MERQQSGETAKWYKGKQRKGGDPDTERETDRRRKKRRRPTGEGGVSRLEKQRDGETESERRQRVERRKREAREPLRVIRFCLSSYPQTLTKVPRHRVDP